MKRKFILGAIGVLFTCGLMVLLFTALPASADPSPTMTPCGYIFINSTAGGSVVEPGEGYYQPPCMTWPEPTIVLLWAEAELGYSFDVWTGDVEEIDDIYAAYTTIAWYMGTTVSITANFAPGGTPTLSPTPTSTISPTPTVSLSASPTPSASPTVSPTPTMSPTISATPTPTPGPGDVNGDFQINACDITQCELCILYPETYPKEDYPGWDANEDTLGPNSGDVLAVELRILQLWPP